MHGAPAFTPGKVKKDDSDSKDESPTDEAAEAAAETNKPAEQVDPDAAPVPTQIQIPDEAPVEIPLTDNPGEVPVGGPTELPPTEVAPPPTEPVEAQPVEIPPPPAAPVELPPPPPAEPVVIPIEVPPAPEPAPAPAPAPAEPPSGE